MAISIMDVAVNRLATIHPIGIFSMPTRHVDTKYFMEEGLLIKRTVDLLCGFFQGRNALRTTYTWCRLSADSSDIQILAIWRESSVLDLACLYP